MNYKKFLKIIDLFRKARIVVIGDLMVDRFIRGKVSRISPEAPVPVVAVKEVSTSAGGAGNVVLNLSSLGAQVSCCGIVGADDAGENLIRQFQNSGVDTEGIVRDPHRPTTVKTRVIAEHQQIVRFDEEENQPVATPLQSVLKQAIRGKLKKSDAVILSDYGKGMITKRILTVAIYYSELYKKPICVDPKVEHFSFYKRATCITPNLSEAMGGMHRVKLTGEKDFHNLGRDILRELQSKSVLITQGEEGMTLFEKNRITHIPTKAKEVYDVTGAGDTVIAVLTLSLACGASLVEAASLANLAAGIVVGKLGTATVSPSEVKEALKLL